MSNGPKRFEVSLYNKDVRKFEEQNKVHPNFNSDWAHLQFFTYEGESERDILEQVRRKYPERKGFVIDKVVQIKEYEFIRPVGQRF